MSSLLDVLHKRPPRSQVTAPEPAPNPAQEPEDTPPEKEAAAGAPTLELRLAPEHEAAQATLTMRRWTDPAPVEQAPPQPGSASAAPSVRRPPRKRTPVFVALAVAVTAALGFVAYKFTRTSDEGFLAAPGQAMPAPAQPAGAQNAAPAEAVARETAKPGTEKRSAAADESSDTGRETDAASGDPAWYDQPALPAGQAAAPVIQITHGSTQNPLFEKLRDAYAALQSGDAARAESLYRDVLAADPNSVDALLGLASLAARGGRFDEARDLYRRVQGLDPKNATATASLSGLPGGDAQSGAESQLKGMLREQPDSSALNFALGLRYVADQRWPDAQAAFFEAVRNDPTNADYAFNLAVSLDRLGQAQAAASYYQRAIDLAAGSQQFAVATARARLATLRGPQG